jgi:S-adenosylmethionine:tRNA-ribosyltransferase-isomerase (queuine synthetase)
VDDGDKTTVGQTADHFMHRMLEQVMSEETRAFWIRRAQTFDAVGTTACREIAQACRNRAAMAEYEDFSEIIAQVVDEVSEEYFTAATPPRRLEVA